MEVGIDELLQYFFRDGAGDYATCVGGNFGRLDCLAERVSFVQAVDVSFPRSVGTVSNGVRVHILKG